MNSSSAANTGSPWAERQERELSLVTDVWEQWLGGSSDLASGSRLRVIIASRLATWRDPSSVQAGIFDVLSPYASEWSDRLEPEGLADVLSDRLIQAGRMNPLKTSFKP